MSDVKPCKWLTGGDGCAHQVVMHLCGGSPAHALCHGCPSHEPAEPAKPETCEWIQDWEGNWTGTCGVYWITDDVGSMKHCPNCGRTVTATPYTEPEEDDDAE